MRALKFITIALVLLGLAHSAYAKWPVFEDKCWGRHCPKPEGLGLGLN